MYKICYRYFLVHKREDSIMSKNGKKKRELDKIFLRNTAITATITTVVTVIVQCTFSNISGIFDLPHRFSALEAQMQEMKNDMDEYTDSDLNTQIALLENSIDVLEKQVDECRDILFSSIKLVPTEYTTSEISLTFTAAENNESNIVQIDKNNILAINVLSGQEYRAEQLVDQNILLPYTEDQTEIYFYGKFNENMHWDGECLINAYNMNNELSIIMEAKYDDGVLKEYKQVIPYTTQNGTNVWVVSERKHEGDINIGESRNYIRKETYKKDFDIDTVLVSDILTVDKLISSDSQLEAYYYGNTSNGYYNDDTGNAYLIKLAEDGTVLTLYKGCFRNGQFHDDTGNAWYIVRSEGTGYMYYKGAFEYGGVIKDENSIFENPLSKERIEEIIENEKFNCDLRWYGLDIV